MNFKLNGISAENSYQGEDRQGHSVLYIQTMNSLLVYGGSNDHHIYLFNLDKKKWTKQATQGKMPSSTRYHTAYYEQNKNIMIIYGGQIQRKTSAKDFYMLILDNWKWKKIFLLHQPQQRQNHLMLCYKGQLIIFGGLSLPYQKLLNDVFILKNLSNLQISNKQEIHGCQCTNIQTYGETPKGRYGMSGYIHDKKMYVIGGRSHCEEIFLTVYSLCLRKYNWKLEKVNHEQNIPQMHMLCICKVGGNDKMLILGGIINESMKRNKTLIILSINNIGLTSLSQGLKGSQKFMSGNYSVINLLPTLIVNLYWKSSVSFSQPMIKFLYQQSVENLNQQVSKISTEKYFKTEQIDSQPIKIEEYLIAIKNEQILSQQLISKNSNLELLYRQIQNYTAHLYQSYTETGKNNLVTEKQKQQHIHHCLELKDNYKKISDNYQQVVQKINHLREQLTHIDSQFDKCMDTQLDEDL